MRIGRRALCLPLPHPRAPVLLTSANGPLPALGTVASNFHKAAVRQPHDLTTVVLRARAELFRKFQFPLDHLEARLTASPASTRVQSTRARGGLADHVRFSTSAGVGNPTFRQNAEKRGSSL